MNKNEFMDKYNIPIPKGEELKEYRKTNFVDEGFVELPKNFYLNGVKKLVVDMQYPKKGFKHAIDKALVREGVAKKLLKVTTLLPDGIALVIWDAYRPFELQKELYYQYKEQIIEDFKLNGLSEDEQEQHISQYVSLPIKDTTHPPLHTTGGAVDVALIDTTTGEILNFGAEFDEFSDNTQTDKFEGEDSEREKNRRLLYHVMNEVGFTNLSSEWWHFGDRR